MSVFDLEWIGIIITGFATLFLIGEVLVNMRGIFALLGIGFITVYFGAYVETGSFIIMLIIYFVGLLLIIIDGKLLNDGTLATIGLACMLTAVALPAPNLASGLYAVLGVLLGGGASFFFLKVFKRRDMWNKLTLTDQLTKEAGYNSMNQSYEQLLNKVGVTLNDLRPVGTIRIEQKDYSAVSNGQWISKDTKVKVVQVDGTKILVEIING
ncbi:MAG: NfeD family protein [Bacillota bacterium]|uniref:Nodulation protein NfeD n=1 Tax=Virgibacillus salarius TaxID=447199 RepID=A0A941I9Q8_9BACI|nr:MULTISPECIES: NfeD family protein [Bacillaceae]MBR7797014.1 nodulation protein NfeD [Virgibacillus salarius]MDY7042749.1 NfeD family protein [Virgibacillus sp. M23]NAZ09724.1 nodulation protein NfeD [Agaribacter marinus]WBX79124.1 NfeD family protein [Virgibacillus salarius]